MEKVPAAVFWLKSYLNVGYSLSENPKRVTAIGSPSFTVRVINPFAPCFARQILSSFPMLVQQPFDIDCPTRNRYRHKHLLRIRETARLLILALIRKMERCAAGILWNRAGKTTSCTKQDIPYRIFCFGIMKQGPCCICLMK